MIRLKYLRRVIRRTVCQRPVMIVVAWILASLAVWLTAPSLTKLAAEGDANSLPPDIESIRASGIVATTWPDQAYESMVVVALQRPGTLTEADTQFAGRLAGAFEASDRPRDVLRVMGPRSSPEVAGRLVSRDRAMQLVAVPLASSFVSPSAHRAIAWLQDRAARLDRERPEGLQVLWTGDAVIGRDYMKDVAQSLDRAAVATVVLLLAVLVLVYRSALIALVPLVTIGVSLVVARGVLAWLATAGWAISPLVELFLVVILFGSGTDFCLFLAWRFGEHWDGSNPCAAMEATLYGSTRALLTSAGTVIAGLSLMGLTRFKLFSSTGPSVALGLAIALIAALTLTPALLVILARYRPRSFGGLSHHSGALWDRIARRMLKRPLLIWLATLALMAGPVVLGLSTTYIQDTLSELPARTASVLALRQVAARFGNGFLAPLTIVLESRSGSDLRQSEGLALIDDVSHFLNQSKDLEEVRSATQPMGSTDPLQPARIGSRLTEVNKGFGRMAEGAEQLHEGLNQGVAKLRLAAMLQSAVKGAFGRRGAGSEGSPDPGSSPGHSSSDRLATSVKGTAANLGAVKQHVDQASEKAAEAAVKPAAPATSGEDPSEAMARELTRAAVGAGQIAEGARRAGEEVAEILQDPVGRRTLDRLLITPRTVSEHPELREAFAAYISDDGKRARIDVIQKERMDSEAAMDQVEALRRRLGEYLDVSRWLPTRAEFTGGNARAADTRALTRSDQHRTWLIVPSGVFVILLLALRDPFACLNLVATMILTYTFALGATHAVFVTGLGAEGLDWKVPYFLFVLLVAVGVDYNVFLMTRLHEEARGHGLQNGIRRAVAATGGLISSAAAITACSFASLMLSPLGSLRQLGFAMVVGVTVDAVLVRPVLVPCGHWLMKRRIERNPTSALSPAPEDTPVATAA